MNFASEAEPASVFGMSLGLDEFWPFEIFDDEIRLALQYDILRKFFQSIGRKLTGLIRTGNEVLCFRVHPVHNFSRPQVVREEV